MAPKELVGRYKLYKSKTKNFLYWLTQTASTCCDLKTVVKSLATSAKVSRNKGGENVELDLDINTVELLKLAQAIASADPPADVPEGILLIIQDIIHGREQCATWYSAQALAAGGEVDKENESHRYFIMVLRRVLDTLQLVRRRSSRTDQVSGTKPKKKDKKGKASLAVDDFLPVAFQGLEVEEPSDNPLGSAQKADTVDPHTKWNFKMHDDEKDSAFEIFCFLQDLDEVRVAVKEAWTEYARGEISFLAASTITDTAFGILHRTDGEFAQSGPLESSEYLDITRYIGIGFFTRGNVIWMCPHPDRLTEDPRVPDSQTNVAELLCPVAHMCLTTYLNEALEFCSKVPRKWQDPGETPLPCGVPACVEHRFHPLCHTISKLIPQIHEMGHMGPCAHVVVDEFVRGLINLHLTRMTPMWLVVACQIYMELHDVLGDQMDHGAGALYDTMRHNVQLCFEVESYEKVTGDSLEGATEAMDKLAWVAHANNRFENAYATQRAAGLTPEAVSERAEVLFSASPMERAFPAFAGAVLADMKIATYDAGCAMANYNSIVLSMAHLYRGLRSMGALHKDWQDMEFVLPMFGDKKPLVTTDSTAYHGEAAVRHYLLALGLSATEFAPDSRNKQKHRKFGAARQIAITSPLIRALSEYQAGWKKHSAADSKSRIVEAVLAGISTEEEGRPTRRASAKALLSASQLTPSELLAAFKNRLLHDEPIVSFDLFLFTLKSAVLLRTVANEVGSLLGVSKIDDKQHIILVSNLLRSPAHSVAVWKAAGIIRNFIDDKGKTLVKRAYDQSSGRIPRELRPKIEHDVENLQMSRLPISTLLDHAGTKYSFSGPTLCAYDPRVVPEMCGHNIAFCCQPKGGETDPDDHFYRGGDGRRKMVVHGSALPEGISEAARTNITTDPRAFLENLQRLAVFKAERGTAGCGTLNFDFGDMEVLELMAEGSAVVPAKIAQQ